jgi:hypothetical protein
MDTKFITFDKVPMTLSQNVYCLNIFNGEVAPRLVINVTSEQEYNCKHFSSREARTEWLNERNNFIDYLMSFYGEGGVRVDMFDGKSVTRDEVVLATNAIDKAGGSEQLAEGDTFSREMVRDYMLLCRGLEDVEWKEIVKPWYDAFKPIFHK